MEKINPTVSIIVRTKDRPTLLRRALASVAAQTYRPLEAVVVNDGGLPLDESALREALGDVPLRLETLPNSTGRAHAANVGLSLAGGAWIGFLDDDDELMPRHVLTLVNAAVLTGSPVVYSDCETVERELAPDGTILREQSRGRFFLSRDFSADVLLFENYIPLMCLLYSREAIAGIGGFDETLELFEDWEFNIRVAARSTFTRVPETTARYIQWSRTEQIAFSGEIDGRPPYLGVLAKHRARIDHQAILAYYLAKQAEKREDREHLQSLEVEVDRLVREIARMDHGAEEQQRALAESNDRLASAQALIDAITRSLAWKVIHTYRTGVKELVVPQGSRRRRVYDAGMSALARRTRTRPLPAAWGQPAEGPQPAVVDGAITKEEYTPPSLPRSETIPVMAVVSVAIPTHNAGEELREVLGRLRSQTGVAEVEVVAVDSGSTDRTLAICREFGVRVAPYRGDRFNHGDARTQALELTRGEFVVFMSQDTLPAGAGALARMAGFLRQHPEVSAVSAREVPRSDADLFSCWQRWWFAEKILGYTTDTVVGLDGRTLESLPPEERRRLAQVNNVFCCVRRSALDEVGLRPLPFAEDLDFGLRLLERGRRLGFMPSVAAVHSHDRPAAYHLKRAFVDWLAQVDLLGFAPLDWSATASPGLGGMVIGLDSLYRRLDTIVPAVSVRGGADAVRDDLVDRLAARDWEAGPEWETSLPGLHGALLAAVGMRADPRGAVAASTFRDRYVGLLHDFFAFARGIGDLESRADDLKRSLFHLYGHLAGWCLADHLAWAEREQRAEPGHAALRELMGGGV
jgi:glycosyltransferase involved in cell wall biosynthesis